MYISTLNLFLTKSPLIMKRLFTILMAAFLSLNVSYAQLADGSIAPDWTLTDINGTAHNLYNYLDNSYTVFIDFSAVWCGPCWSYHTSGALEDLYENHGPAGFPNVSPNTTDDVMVFFIEGDASDLACLHGTGCGTAGDWVTGTHYPIICTDGTVNTDAISSTYAIGYWPTIYMICPDRTLIEAGQSSNPYSLLNCSPAATFSNDPKVLTYSAAEIQCNGTLAPMVTIMNNGINNLTSLDFQIDVSGATTINTTYNWTGNLNTYQAANVVLPTLTGLQGYEFVMITISNPNNGGVDGDMNNNVIGFTSYPSGSSTGVGQITASISQNGNTLTANSANGDAPFTYMWNTGASTQTISPSTGGSYSVTIEDANGCISNPATHILTLSTNVEELMSISNLKIYPNPSENVFNISFTSEKTQDYTLSIRNVLGELLYTEMLSDFTGAYSKKVALTNYAKTIYFLEIETKEGKINKKLLLQ